MDSRHPWLWLLAALAACPVEKTDSAKGDTAMDSPADTSAGCDDGMTKDEWIDAWNLSFCTWAGECEIWIYGESMERCYELTMGKNDRCLDECRTADALAAMQAHEASGSCESVPDEGAVPYCDD